jgi:SAM-dependent methyltransferase
MKLSRRHVAAAGTAAVMLALLGGCAQTTQEYKPSVGQAGKDVIWVPTPDSVVQRMLDMAKVTAKDNVVDLGSGDGKIAIAAAKRGARARGIEYNPDMVALSRRNAQEQRVNVAFEKGDIFKSDFSDADVVTLYLLPQLNERLRPILLDMRPGTRVTSHQFTMGDWEPDRSDDVEGRQAHLWIVPAKVGGDWAVSIADEPEFRLHLSQDYQKLGGHVVRGGTRHPLQAPRIDGASIRFTVPDAAGAAMRFEGQADNRGVMNGTVTLPNGQGKAFSATKVAGKRS